MKCVERWPLISLWVVLSGCDTPRDEADSSVVEGSVTESSTASGGTGGSPASSGTSSADLTGGTGGSTVKNSSMGSSSAGEAGSGGTSGSGGGGDGGSGGTSGSGAQTSAGGAGGSATGGAGGSEGEANASGGAGAVTSSTGGSGGTGGIEGSLITNGHFSSGSEGWGIETHGGDEPSVTVSGGVLCLDFEDVSAITLGWPTEGNPGAALADGTAYTVSFRARSDPAMDYFHAVAGLAAPPYTQYAMLYTTLATEWQVYSYEIAGNGEEMGLAFNLQIFGPATFCIDDIVLVPSE